MKYYTCAYTSAGVRNFTNENVFDAKNVIEIRSNNRHIADAVLNRFCQDICEPFNEIIAPGSKNLKSGIILKNRKFAVVSDYSHGAQRVNLDDALGLKCQPALNCTMPKAMEAAYKDAKKIHDDWEKIYIGNMDFSRLDSYCRHIISVLVKSQSKAGNSKVYRRFFGTTSLEGTVNFIDNLTFDLSKRYFIKGRPGTGKSTFLKRLSSALLDRGFDIEQYCCSFDPNSLDMVVSRELSLCVFDSTSPHEKFPEREGDIILDFYEEAGLCGIDEKYAKQLSEAKKAYDAKIKEGNEAFKDVMIPKNKENKDELAKINDEDILSAVEILKSRCK